MTLSGTQAARLLAAAGAACCCTLLAAACGTPTTISDPTPSPGAPSGAPATSGPAGTTPAPGGTTSGGQQCATSALHASLPQPSVSALGHTRYSLSLTNHSAAPCTLYGYPGVSFVASPGGSQIGAAAARAASAYIFQDQPPQTITVAPGQSAHADLQLVTAGNLPPAQCGLATAHWLRVYPPDQTAPLYVNLTAQTCSSASAAVLTVSPVQPGSPPSQPA